MNKSIFKFLIYNRWVAFLHDLLWVPAAFLLAYLLRFNLEGIPTESFPPLIKLITLAVPIQGLILWFFDLYRGFWRFASIPDLIRILKAACFGTLLIAFTSVSMLKLEGIPRSVFFLYPILLIAGLCLSRITYRWIKDNRLSLSAQNGKRTLIIGAGRAGEMLVRDLLHRSEYLPAAFVDDDPEKVNREIHGIRVVGGTDELSEIVRSLSVELVLLAIPSADRTTLQRIVTECSTIGVACQTLPSVFEMAGEKVDASKLRSVTVEDLLGRDTVQLDHQAIADYLVSRTVLVTGGGGSIGSELCRQVARIKPKRLVIFDHGEFNLYSIDHELRASFPDLKLIVVLGDVKNAERVDWVFKKFKPDVVFHAAAYKHVPMVEINPAEGVSNNVLGTCRIADAAQRYGVDRFVLVSTDKAVNPANVMGTTKRIAELYCQNLDARSETKFITTRFGNVLGSAGSVVPLFQRQIEEGGPVTVTHPKISRYFMTIPESVSLILQAGSMGQGGEIFVLDMGEPVAICDLARQMIRLSGLEPDKDIDIVYTGLRPGEKLYEELLHETEGLQPTNHEKLLLACSREVDWNWLMDELESLQLAAASRNVEKLYTSLQAIVPEYKRTAGQG